MHGNCSLAISFLWVCWFVAALEDTKPIRARDLPSPHAHFRQLKLPYRLNTVGPRFRSISPPSLRQLIHPVDSTCTANGRRTSRCTPGLRSQGLKLLLVAGGQMSEAPSSNPRGNGEVACSNNPNTLQLQDDVSVATIVLKKKVAIARPGTIEPACSQAVRYAGASESRGTQFPHHCLHLHFVQRNGSCTNRPRDARHDGKWRRIRVRLRLPRKLAFLQAHARTGYYASAGSAPPIAMTPAPNTNR